MDNESANPGAARAKRGFSGAAAGLVALCSAAYFMSYLTRKSYDASILAICDSTGLLRTAASLASTAAVVMYGSGQLVTGFLADRLDPRKMIFAALLVTAGCNASMPVAAGCVPAMVALWAVNGFAQAMFWPPLVKIVAVNLPAESFKSAVFWISVACNAAIVTVFVLVSGCIRFAGWRTSFAVVSVLAVAMAAAWRASVFKLAPEASLPAGAAAGGRGGAGNTAAAPAGRVPMAALLASAGVFPVMAVIACHGIIRDGIEVWAPSIVRDQYGLGTSGSVFSVALLPLFAVGSMVVARRIRRAVGDEMRAAFLLFCTALGCAAFLFATRGATLAVGLPALAVLSASMHGANLMLIGELPGRFARHGRVGAVSGLLNAFTYVGAAAAIYCFAALRERFSGWRPVFALWMAVLSLGIVLLLFAMPRWLRFRRSEEGGEAA